MNPAKLLIIGILVLLPSHGMTREEATPDMEMLEFLGSFETASGKPVDPLGFADFPAKDSRKEPPAAAKKEKARRIKPETQEKKERDNEK
jgi:hypothetical protein